MSAAENVTASFTAQHMLGWAVVVPTVAGFQLSADIHIQPGDFSQHLTAGTHLGTLMFPDGTVVTIGLALNGFNPATSITWSGACAGSSGYTCTTTMNSDQSFTAQINLL